MEADFYYLKLYINSGAYSQEVVNLRLVLDTLILDI